MRPFHRLMGLAAVAACTLCAACTKPDPTFKVNDLITNDGLVGEWVEVKQDAQDPTRLVIKAEPQPCDAGRLVGRSTDSGQLAEQLKKCSTTAYVINATFPKAQTPGAAGKPEVMAMTLRGYLLRTDGDPVICLQNDTESEDSPSGIAASLFSTPTTLFMSVKIDGDTLTIRTPRAQVSLLPVAKMLDEPSAPTDGSSADLDGVLKDPEAKVGTYYSASPDRVIAVYRHYAGHPNFWESETLVLTRVKK